MIFDDSPGIRIGNQNLPSIAVDQSFKYLCSSFTASGIEKADLDPLHKELKILQKAPAKPQQKLFFLCNYLLPKQYHSLIFSKMSADSLKKTDISVRKTVQQILHLPHDVPKAAFHAKVADGGLEVP